MARAKHTDRAEARRRYRQTGQPDDAAAELEANDAQAHAPARSTGKVDSRAAQMPPARPGFMSAFRTAYHTPHVREDLGHWRELITSRALLAALALVIAGGAGFVAFPAYTGSTFAWELLVLPGQALAPQLVAGFFAPRASYLLGFAVGLAQGIVFSLLYPLVTARLGAPLPPEQVGNMLTLSFITGPISGIIFASAAAWYRRFLSLSSPRRTAAARGRTPAKGNQSRRAAGR